MKCIHGISLNKECIYCANGTEPHNVSASGSSELLCMKSAPHDGTPVLIKIKDSVTKPWGGLFFVGRNNGDSMLWGFAAPVGQGGFSDEWMEGWLPLPNT